MPSKNEDSIASEVLSASLGGAISASILYPLEVLKTKMQADVRSGSGDDENHHDEDDEDENHNNGVVSLNSDYDDDEVDDDNNNNKKSAAKNNNNTSMIEYARDMYDREGASVFVRGMETSAFQSSCEKALYFFSYTLLKNMHNAFLWRPKDAPIPTMNNLLLGYLAEWAHLPITLPIDCWTTQIQTLQDDGATATKSSGNPAAATTSMQLLLVLLQKGPSTWYKGISAYVVLCLKPAIQYTVFEQIKTMILTNRRRKQQQNRKQRQSSSSSSDSLSAMEAFLLGMVARTVATMITFPWIRAKVIMQTQIKNNNTNDDDEETTTTTTMSKNNNNSVLALLLQMYQKGGIPSWYQGIGPELTRGIFSAALMLMIKEKINGVVKTMI